MQQKSFEQVLEEANNALKVIRNTNYEPDVLIKEGNRTYAVKYSEHLKSLECSKQQLEKYRFRLDLFCLPLIGSLFILMLLVWLI